jgi:cobalt-zinc-cadmium efflux system outer membrane protein
MSRAPVLLAAAVWSLWAARTLAAQTDPQPPLGLIPVTRAAAVAAALRDGNAQAIGRADTMLARAGLRQARALPNPVLASSYTGSAPQLHASLDISIDLPWLRRLRIAGAEANRESAALRFAYTRASVRYDVEVAYGLALAAGERVALSALAARDADSLRTLARVQREAGAASDMDVELATINAEQQANATLGDSLAAVGALLDLQVLMGVPADVPRLTLVDSLPSLLSDLPVVDTLAMPLIGIPRPPRGSGGATAALSSPPLSVAAAQSSLQSQDLALRLARRRSSVVPSLQLGVEGRDPTGGPGGPLPIIGLSIPLPIFNRFEGDIALADANRQRAVAELQAARRSAIAATARAQRELAVAARRLARDRQLVTLARSIAAKAVTAYTAGATPLSDVLQAQRSARDALAQYVADAIATATAAAAVRLATTTNEPP